MNEHDFNGFLIALGQEFCESLSAIAGSEDIVPQDANEVFLRTFGQNPSPQLLATLSESELEQWRAGWEMYFECRGISVDQMRRAVAQTLARWPATDTDRR
jgi:hypothetical protein